VRPEYLETIENMNLDKEISNQAAFDDLFSDMEVVDKSWIYSQYDSMVQTNTIKGPGSLMVLQLESKRLEKLYL
jgi:phosphoribosylformylglycinamidine (FGAM) synthase-like enzyme